MFATAIQESELAEWRHHPATTVKRCTPALTTDDLRASQPLCRNGAPIGGLPMVPSLRSCEKSIADSPEEEGHFTEQCKGQHLDMLAASIRYAVFWVVGVRLWQAPYRCSIIGYDMPRALVGCVLCVRFLSAIVLTAVAQMYIARTGGRGETLQVGCCYWDLPDVMSVCAVTTVQSS